MFFGILQVKQLEKRIQRLTREIENHEVTNSELKEEVDTLEVKTTRDFYYDYLIKIFFFLFYSKNLNYREQFAN